MNLSAIVAMDNNNGIGYRNQIPWYLPSDLKYFKDQTYNQTIIMGRQTLDSLPGLLPNRKHIVLTRNQEYFYPGANICHDLLDVQACLGPDKTGWVIGGAEIYELFEPYISKIHITQVLGSFNVDKYFPIETFDSFRKWDLESQVWISADDKNPFKQRRIIYQRDLQS